MVEAPPNWKALEPNADPDELADAAPKANGAALPVVAAVPEPDPAPKVNAAPEEAWLPAPKAFAENADGPDDPVLEPKATPVPEPKAGAGADAEVEEPNPKAAGACVLLGGAAPKTAACRIFHC